MFRCRLICISNPLTVAQLASILHSRSPITAVPHYSTTIATSTELHIRTPSSTSAFAPTAWLRRHLRLTRYPEMSSLFGSRIVQAVTGSIWPGHVTNAAIAGMPEGSWYDLGPQKTTENRNTIPAALTYHSEPESDVEVSRPGDILWPLSTSSCSIIG